MKTPLNKILDFIEEQEYNFLNKEQLDSCNLIKNKIIKMLAEERQMVIDAYKAGQENNNDSLDEIAETYFELTYNPKQNG